MEKKKIVHKQEKSPHDIFFLASMRILVVARDFFKAHLAPEIIRNLDLDSLVLIDNLLKEGEEEPPYAFIIYECYTKDGVRVYLYAMLGDPRKDPYMVKHIEEYNARLTLRYIEENNEDFPIIYHCCLIM